jgi:hypothetical protein
MSRLPLAPRARTVSGVPLARAPGQPVVPNRGAKWRPKYDWAVEGRELAPAQTAEEAIAGQGDDPWTKSPPSSHTEMFRLIDASTVRPITVMGPDGPHQSLAGSRLAVVNARSGVGSTIWVRFKPKGPRPAYTYVFFFYQDHATARSVFAEMAATNSPWTVGHKRLEMAGVPYKRVSGASGET